MSFLTPGNSCRANSVRYHTVPTNTSTVLQHCYYCTSTSTSTVLEHSYKCSTVVGLCYEHCTERDTSRPLWVTCTCTKIIPKQPATCNTIQYHYYRNTTLLQYDGVHCIYIQFNSQVHIQHSTELAFTASKHILRIY
jgi:hypothetical protein